MRAMNEKKERHRLNPDVNRRTFLKVSGALASVPLASRVFTRKAYAAAPVVTGENPPDGVETAEDIIYSVCQMCHSRCGVRAKVKEGVLVKLDGNPYHPNNRDVDGDNRAHRLPYVTDPVDAVKELGRMCLKGQAGVQTLYDPFRIQSPLRRVGPRNSGSWEAISWEQAFSEIAARIDQLIPPGERDELIDPAMPGLGTKRNQLAFSPGRSVEKEMSERIWKHGWGTVNSDLAHTSICEETRHVANELITWDPAGKKNRMGGGRTEGWQPDILGAEYIIFFGANPLEADFPMLGMARNLMQFKRNGGRYVSVDPRFNRTAARANQWVPIVPGTDAALAMGMISWILENGRYDRIYLENANKGAADADGQPTWTDATYLVGSFTDRDGKPFHRYITAKEAGLSNGTTVLDGDCVVQASGGNQPGNRKGNKKGKPFAGDTAGLAGCTTVPHGELEAAGSFDLTIDGVTTNVPVQTAFSLLRESALSRTRDEYASICGVPRSTMEALAAEFVGHGRKAVAITYRGPIKHTNGFYNQIAIQHLNTLIGNYDWRGGCTSGGGGWGHKSGVVNLGKVAGGPAPAGVRIDRAMTFYDEKGAGSLFAGYPARRPWFPFATHGNYQEVIPSIQDGYPYPIKVLITYWNAWPYSTPALRKVWEATVADESRLPLLVSISPVIGEVAAWADYILPDSVYLEKFSVPGIPWRVNKGTSFQRPVVGAFDGRPIGVSPANGGVGNAIPPDAREYTPFLPGTKAVLDIHIGLAKALGLPGVGAGALLDDAGNPVGDLHNSWDWARAILANLEANARSDRPGVTVEAVLARGGVFDDPGDEYQGEQLSYKYGNIIRTFADPVARTMDSVTGTYFSGVAQYIEPAHSDGTTLRNSGYPFRLITYKTVNHGQARTNVNPWLMLVNPENRVEISARDAAAMQVETGDLLRVTSPTNPAGIVGKAKVTQGLMPGIVAISHHYGHWEQHSRLHLVDGVAMGHDPSRGAGIQPTQVMRTDKVYPNVSLQDKIGGSCAFYDTWVQIARVSG